MLLGMEQKASYPVMVKIVEEDSSLVVHISLKATWGTFASQDLCSFYDEFGTILKQASTETQIKQPVLSSQKIPEGDKKPSSSPPPSPPSPPSLSLSPPPPPSTPSPSPIITQKISQPPLPPVVGSYRQARVIWDYVNLREGPGIHYKIVGKAYMNNTFEILDENPSWLRVRLENRTEGWMSKRAASETFTTPSSPKPPSSSYDAPKTKFPKKPHSPM
jgi:uncharacterized protein YgiM (DUF1202 family)